MKGNPPPLTRLSKQVEATQDPAINVVTAGLRQKAVEPQDHHNKMLILNTIVGLQHDPVHQRDREHRAALAELLVLATAAQTSLKQRLDAAPDWRSHANGADRDSAWEHQQALSGSLKALSVGVSTEQGAPSLPAPLMDLLTHTCEACGHQSLQWLAPIPDLENQIADLDKRITARAAQIAEHHRVAAEILGIDDGDKPQKENQR